MSKEQLRVLLIEDNPGDAFLIKFYLEESSSDYLFEHAEEFQKGCDLLEKDTFDIVLVDLNLPDSFGLDTVKNLTDKFPEQLVIVMTGLTDESTGIEALKLGAQDFLVKGKFDGNVLNSSIRYAFERFQLSDKLESTSSELDHSNSRFAMVQELSGIGYFEIDKNSHGVFISESLKSMLEFKEDYPNMNALKGKLAQDENLVQALESALGSETGFEGEYAIGIKRVKVNARSYKSDTDNRDKLAGVISIID